MYIGQKYQQRNVFASIRDSNGKLSIELAVPNFQKQSFQKQQNLLRKPVEKLCFSDDAGLKSVALLKKMNPLTINTRTPRNVFVKELLETKTSLITISKVANN